MSDTSPDRPRASSSHPQNRPPEKQISHVDVLAALPDPVFLCTAEGHVVYGNRRARELTGYSDDEFAEMNVVEDIPRHLRSVVRDKLDEVVNTGSARLVVPAPPRKDHTVLYEIRGSLVTWEGKERICGIARDISQHTAREETFREQEDAFRLLVEEVKEYAIFMMDREGHVTTWNAGAEKIKGYTESEIIGKHFSIFYPEEALEAGRTKEALDVAAREGQWIDEGWRLRKDGSRFWARVTVTALYGEDGELKGFAKLTRDLTDRRRREETLKQKNALLQLTQEVSQIANEAVHFEEALEKVTKAICNHVGWPVGHVYWLYEGETPLLVSSGIWHLQDEKQFEAFRRVTEAANFDIGVSLPGRVAARDRPIWIEDVTEDPNFVRSQKGKSLGVKGAFAVPVQRGKGSEETVAVLEFFSSERQERDEELLEAVRTVGVQLSRVAERQQTREELRQSEEHFRRLFEAAQEGISIISPRGEILDANPAALEMFGYSREDLSGLNVEQLSANSAEWRDLTETLRRQGHLRRREFRFRTAGGEEMICEMSVTVHREVKGQPVAYQCFIREITDRKRAEKALKESEEKFRALAEQSLIGIELIQDGVYEYVNPTFAEYFGYSQEELIGRSPEAVFHPEDWPKVKEKIRRRLSSEKQDAQFRARGRAKSGETLYLEVYGQCVEYQGRPALVGATLDMTEQRQLQRDALRAQEEERRKFGRDLHDGVASQLTGIRLHLGTAKQMLDDDHPAHRQVEKAIALADESGEDVRRLSRGLNPVCLEDRKLTDALKSLSENTEGGCFEQDGDLPPLSEEQKTQLYWIAQEAVTNALKYAEADEISIRLRSTSDGVVLIVEDDGRGFELSAESHGLGLRSMKYRAELLEGTFTLSSKPGAGTRIECRLQPLRD